MKLSPKRVSWRHHKGLFSPDAVRLFEASQEAGYGEVTLLDGMVESHQRIIVPRPNQPFKVGFRDTAGEWHPELEIAMHPNGTSTRYLDPALSARPPYPLFTIGNGTESYQPPLEEVYADLQGVDVREVAFDWLSRRELITFLFSVHRGTLIGEFVGPIEMAQALISFNLIHRVFTYDELEEIKPADTSFFVAPGLRRTIFGGNQNVNFYPEKNGRFTIIGSSVYRGCLNKKPIFVALGWRLAEQGDMACHASMASPHVESGPGRDCTFIIQCDSGRGKTELRKEAHHYRDLSGQLILGYRGTAPKGRILTVPYYPECHPRWMSHGDDGVVIRLNPKNCSPVKQPGDEQFAEGENWELGAFDRISGIYGPNDSREVNAMLKLAKWWTVQADNLRANSGDNILPWERELVDGVPSPNPRLTYSNELLGQTGVPTSQASLRLKHSLIAFAPIDDITCNGPWAKLPRGLAALTEILGGPDAVRSKSVSNVPANKVLKARRVKFGHIGTMAQFSALPLQIQIDQVLAFRGSFPAMTCHLVTQERLPSGVEINGSTALKEIEYVPELLIRDLMYAAAIGRASIDWAPSPYPFLGYVPTRVILGDTELPAEYFSPGLIYGNRLQLLAEAWYEHVVNELKHLEARGISPMALELFNAYRGLYHPEGRVVPLAPEESERRMEALTAVVDKCKGMAVRLE